MFQLGLIPGRLQGQPEPRRWWHWWLRMWHAANSRPQDLPPQLLREAEWFCIWHIVGACGLLVLILWGLS